MNITRRIFPLSSIGSNRLLLFCLQGLLEGILEILGEKGVSTK